MLKILAKVNNGKRNTTIDPTIAEPPKEKHIPTLAELNRADKYRADMRQHGSYYGIIAKQRRGE